MLVVMLKEYVKELEAELAESYKMTMGFSVEEEARISAVEVTLEGVVSRLKSMLEVEATNC